MIVTFYATVGGCTETETREIDDGVFEDMTEEDKERWLDNEADAFLQENSEGGWSEGEEVGFDGS